MLGRSRQGLRRRGRYRGRWKKGESGRFRQEKVSENRWYRYVYEL